MPTRSRLAAAVVALLGLSAARCSTPEPAPPPPATRPAAVTAPVAPVRLTVRVVDLRNRAGDLLVGVFATADGFPGNAKRAVGWRVLPADGPATATFDLPPGTYAVGVLHDENRSGSIDTNFLGIPKEGYGVSNNPKPRRRAARFDEATFPLPPGRNATVTLSLQYDFL